MVERISTGIPGLDKFIQGGLPKGSITLVAGTPGTGKSILCAQIAYNGALKGKKCLYLNLEQNQGRLESQMQQFGSDFKKAEKNLKVVAVDTNDPGVVGFILGEVQKLDYDLIVLDSLDSISSAPLSAEEVNKFSMETIVEKIMPTVISEPTIGRMKLKKIFTAIANSKATALLTSEKVENSPGFSRDTISEFLCDGIIAVDMSTLGTEISRILRVIKMRETKHPLDGVPMAIGKQGIELKPI